MPENDIVSDIINRLAERLGADVVPRAVLMSIESEVRQAWAGDTVYVKSSGHQSRNAAIMEKYRAGTDVDRLAALHHITPRRIRQIINRKNKAK